MSLRDLMDQFTLQGPFCIKSYDENTEDYNPVKSGDNLEYACLEDNILDAEIQYMYVEDNVLQIEVEIKKADGSETE